MGASAGRVLLIPKGNWNADTTYTGLDWVRHNGAAWVCKNTCTGIEPNETNTDNWQMMSRDGSQITVDAEISDQSENPVQNKVIKKYVDEHTPEIADMMGATATQNGTHGLVPAPQMGDEKKALLGNGTWGSVDAILTFKTKEEYDTAVANDEIPDGAKVIKEYDDGDSTTIIDVDTVMSDTSENPVQNKVIKKYVDEKQVNIDGVTLTLDEARNVIKLADTLKDAINGAFPAANVANNQITTVEGFALDARQANPNIDGTLAKQLSDLNGSLNYKSVKAVIGSEKIDVSQYIGKEFLIQVNVDNNAFLGISVAGIFGTMLYYSQGSKMPHDISCLLEYDNGTICLKSAYWGGSDKTSTTFMNVYVR